MFYMKSVSTAPRELMHDPAKPQHGPTVLTGYKFKAVQLFKNLGASIACFPSQCHVLLLRVHISLVGPTARESLSRERGRWASNAGVSTPHSKND